MKIGDIIREDHRERWTIEAIAGEKVLIRIFDKITGGSFTVKRDSHFYKPAPYEPEHMLACALRSWDEERDRALREGIRVVSLRESLEKITQCTSADEMKAIARNALS